MVQWTTPLQACLRHPNSTQSTPKSTTMRRHRHSRTTIRTQAVHQTRTKQTICLDRPHLRQITGKISTHILRSAWNIKGMGILNYPFSYRENNVCCSDPDSTAPGGGEHASPWKYHQSFQVLLSKATSDHHNGSSVYYHTPKSISVLCWRHTYITYYTSLTHPADKML